MVKVSIFGATSYTGCELIRTLLRHPDVDIIGVTSERLTGTYIDDHHKSLRGMFHKKLESVGSTALVQDSEVIFMCFTPAVAMGIAPKVLEINSSAKIIDLSGDHRLDDPAVYAAWYGVEHKNPRYVGAWVYGLPEINRTKIKKTHRVANPGCFPTGILLALAPLIKVGTIATDSIIIDSKTGVSGAGRALSQGTHFPECNENFKAYGVGTHKHTPEIEQELAKIAGAPVTVSFTPHLIPMTRGILSTMYLTPRDMPGRDDVLALYKKFYRRAPFVRIIEDGLPETAWVAGSNCCDIGVAVDERTQRLIVVSAIDNLIKGASGQAIQNMNIMQGFDEATALDRTGLFP